MSDTPKCEPPEELRERVARAIHEGLGESWAYSNHSGNEWVACRGMLDSAADAVLAAFPPAEADALRAERDAAINEVVEYREAGALRARVAVLERIAQMLAGFAEKAATLDWDEDNNVTWAAVVAAEARAALSTGSETPASARCEP